jgi:hypothetical protein
LKNRNSSTHFVNQVAITQLVVVVVAVVVHL